ncbi:MAG: ECF transporter S component [Oscillospiraceae bacterium]|nr:ECF transporter S component [Oscillospiraceae bacterium]
MVRKFVGRFSIYHLMIIALLAALGIAVKIPLQPLAQMITGPLFVPGGAMAGGIYMMFPVLAVSITGKTGAAALCGFVQALLVLITGLGGHHGALTIVTYTVPGLAIDLVMLLSHHRGCCRICCFFGSMAANLTGTLLVGAAFFSIPLIPLLLMLCSAALSGGLGGLLAWSITKQLKKMIKIGGEKTTKAGRGSTRE